MPTKSKRGHLYAVNPHHQKANKSEKTHIEQKNWSVMQDGTSYDRLEIEVKWLLMNAIYVDFCLYVTFFQPVLKLIGKEKVSERVINRYDTAPILNSVSLTRLM